jgi:hypothetical protein
MEMPTKRFAAVLVAGVAGLASALAGCGGSEPTKTAGTSPSNTTTTASVPSTPSLPTTVDFNDPKELAAALAALGIETPAMEPLALDRGVTDGLAFPMWPVGDIRKTGLKTFRVDVSPSFEGKAFLKFFDGKKELYSAPFDPAKTTTVGTIPAVVVESLKANDRVTWGVYFDSKKVKPITVDFTVTEKASATKKLAELDGRKTLTTLGRLVARGQVLQNASLLSEALVTFVDVTQTDPSVTSVYTNIVDCLRRLNLKKTPMFSDMQQRVVGNKGNSGARAGFNSGLDDNNVARGGPTDSDLAGRNRVENAPIKPLDPVAVTKKTGGLGVPGGSSLPGIPTPTPAPTTDGTVTEGTAGESQAANFAKSALTMATQKRHEADDLHRRADQLKIQADAARAEADGLLAKASDLEHKAAEDMAKANDTTNGLTDAERTALMEKATQAAAEAQGFKTQGEAAKAKADELAGQVEGLNGHARTLDNEATQLEEQAKGALGAIDPKNPGGQNPTVNPAHDPTGVPKMANIEARVALLKSNVAAAQTNLANAESRVNAAQTAFDAAVASNADAVVKQAALDELNAAKENLANAGSAFAEAQQALANEPSAK